MDGATASENILVIQSYINNNSNIRLILLFIGV